MKNEKEIEAGRLVWCVASVMVFTVFAVVVWVLEFGIITVI